MWIKVAKSEIQTLVENDTFDPSGEPQHGKQIIPIKLIFKAKQCSDGYLDKLKVHGVQCANLQWYKPDEDTWSPCTNSCALRLFLAEAA